MAAEVDTVVLESLTSLGKSRSASIRVRTTPDVTLSARTYARQLEQIAYDVFNTERQPVDSESREHYPAIAIRKAKPDSVVVVDKDKDFTKKDVECVVYTTKEKIVDIRLLPKPFKVYYNSREFTVSINAIKNFRNNAPYLYAGVLEASDDVTVSLIVIVTQASTFAKQEERWHFERKAWITNIVCVVDHYDYQDRVSTLLSIENTLAQHQRRTPFYDFHNESRRNLVMTDAEVVFYVLIQEKRLNNTKLEWTGSYFPFDAPISAKKSIKIARPQSLFTLDFGDQPLQFPQGSPISFELSYWESSQTDSISQQRRPVFIRGAPVRVVSHTTEKERKFVAVVEQRKTSAIYLIIEFGEYSMAEPVAVRTIRVLFEHHNQTWLAINARTIWPAPSLGMAVPVVQ